MSKKSVIKRKKKPTVLIPIIIAALAMLLLYMGATKKAEETIRPITVPFAAKDLEEHTKIEKELVTLREVPASSIPPNVITDPNELLDKYVATKNTVPINGLFYKESIVEFEQIPSRIGMMLDEDNLGLTMRVNLEKSVANSLRDDMDVQVRFFTNKTPSGHAFEGVLEESIRILAVRDSTGTDVSPTVVKSGNEDEKSKQNRNRVPTVIVFEASDEQASYLLRAQELGELNILAVSEAEGKDKDKEDDEVEKKEVDTKILSNQVVNETNENDNEKVANIRSLIDLLSNHIDDENVVKEQTTLLNSLIADIEKKEKEEIEEYEAHGELFNGNEVKLFIDALTHTIESQFKEGYFITPMGEVVVFDKETGELRFFETKERFSGSKYVLQEMTQEELDHYFNSLTDTKTKNKVYRGQDTTTTEKILLQEGLNSFNFKYEGIGEFKVTVVDGNGRRTEVINHSGGKLDTKKAVSARKVGFHVFEVETEGAWEIQPK